MICFFLRDAAGGWSVDTIYESLFDTKSVRVRLDRGYLIIFCPLAQRVRRSGKSMVSV
jgi:hypothetical protein